MEPRKHWTDSIRIRVSALVVFVLVAAFWAWWIIASRVALLDEARAALDSAYTLDQEVAELRARWSDDRAAQVEVMVDRAEKRLLRDFDHLAVWLKQHKANASVLGLQVMHTIGGVTPTPQGLTGVGLVPLQLKIQAAEKGASYQAFVKYFRMLDEEEIRVDVRQANITGSGEGVEDIDLHLNLWMRTEA